MRAPRPTTHTTPEPHRSSRDGERLAAGTQGSPRPNPVAGDPLQAEPPDVEAAWAVPAEVGTLKCWRGGGTGRTLDSARAASTRRPAPQPQEREQAA